MKLQKLKPKNLKKIASTAIAVAAVTAPTLALAGSAGVSEMDAAINYVVTLLTGKYITGIAIVSAAVGVIAFMSGQEMGKLMEVLMRVAIGLGVIVGIATLIDKMRGSGAVLQAAASQLGLG
jgi:type IV secretory pathway VirB2 component (pilin)